jgi:hypothetical protein
MTVNDMSYRAEQISNISVGGCLLPIATDLRPGIECHVRIVLGGTCEERSVRVDGEIVRCAPGAVAIRFVRIDPDSLYHLQNIVRYNSPNPDRIDREIRKHPGLV